jgi:hypothetical protein
MFPHPVPILTDPRHHITGCILAAADMSAGSDVSHRKVGQGTAADNG